VGIMCEGWASGDRARDIIQAAFSAVGLPKFHPHCIRHALIRHATTLDLTPEELKAWSQNLGHTDVLTTLLSYGQVPSHRQGELIHAASAARTKGAAIDDRALLEALAARLGKGGLTAVLPGQS